MTIFVLQHAYSHGSNVDDTKFIGVYTSEAAAQAAIARLMQQPGFRDHPAGFFIDAHEPDETQWSEGFALPASDVALPDAESHEDLEARFRALGAPDPEEWAASQRAEGIPQLHRFLFLRQAWRGIYAEDKPAWITGLIAAFQRDPDAPYAAVGAVLATLRAKGIADEAIVDLVRGVQAELLFHVCYLLEDPGIDEPEAGEIGWGLFALTGDGEAGEPIRGLHESVLELDPTGREMRPRHG